MRRVCFSVLLEIREYIPNPNLYNVALSRPCLFYIWASANATPLFSFFTQLQPPPVCAYRIFALNQKPKQQRNSRKRRRQQKTKMEVASQHSGAVRNKTIDILEHFFTCPTFSLSPTFFPQSYFFTPSYFFTLPTF